MPVQGARGLGVAGSPTPLQHEGMVPAPFPSEHGTTFAALLLEAGLANVAELEAAAEESSEAGLHLDEVLVANSVIDRTVLVRVMARAWQLPVIDLAVDRPDPELVMEWPAETYLLGNWMPVRDQANGSVLVATAREPDEERSMAIEQELGVPVEFVVATSADIRASVRRVLGKPSGSMGAGSRLRAILKRPGRGRTKG
ncbi:MAG: rane-bound glycosyl transferase [Microbacteriaceae bacterium]|nr:rane-bound glycosyl transferase [Microbacteriaceae bacterium]